MVEEAHAHRIPALLFHEAEHVVDAVALEVEVGGTLCFVLQEHGEVAACISLGVKATGEDEHDHQEDVSVWFHINTC